MTLTWDANDKANTTAQLREYITLFYSDSEQARRCDLKLSGYILLEHNNSPERGDLHNRDHYQRNREITEGCNTSESDEFEVGVISGAHRTSDTQHGNSFPSVKLERAATQSPVAAILKTAGEVRVAFSNKDSVDDFIRLNDEIAVNEAAKEESLDYTKAIWDIDKEEATKHLDEIKELMLAINKGKRRRDAALAAVAVSEWSG
ncbi:hypothetical protein PC119_g17146 [Phytophthora cactorum]|nr:hypothetical protein PC119_g17146 [Phytophthora cactorum]KAG3036589.1 hypothetical protein PC120_g135 [Phytophthora cactorum]